MNFSITWSIFVSFCQKRWKALKIISIYKNSKCSLGDCGWQSQDGVLLFFGGRWVLHGGSSVLQHQPRIDQTPGQPCWIHAPPRPTSFVALCWSVSPRSHGREDVKQQQEEHLKTQPHLPVRLPSEATKWWDHFKTFFSSYLPLRFKGIFPSFGDGTSSEVIRSDGSHLHCLGYCS